MHGAPRSPEPGFFEAVRCRYDDWGELYGAAGEQVRNCRGQGPAPCCRAHLKGLDGEGVRGAIRDALRRDFAGICGYCEQDCAGTVAVIEHFRPRWAFPDEWATWLNLVYACERCDASKGDKWPGAPGDYDARYSYVNPSLIANQQPAEEFFEYYVGIDGDADGDMAPGQMMPSANLSADGWWRANRTIEDLDLNSDYELVGSRLPELRTEHLDYVLDEIGDPAADVDRTAMVLSEYSERNQPFSSYVAAFARSLGVQGR